MTIRIVCAGKLKERYWIEAAAEFQKRLSRFAQVEIAEVADEKTPDTLSPAEEAQAMAKEGERMIARIAPQEHVIALTIDGKRYDSPGFAARLQSLQRMGKSRLTFVIGGSLGLSGAVLTRADETLSLSDMTFPHRIARILLLEQVYRAFKILGNETYHK